MNHGVLTRFPDAIRIGGPSQCPCCFQYTEYSFVLPQFDFREYWGSEPAQACGFLCSACGFSNAGYRDLTDGDLEQEDHQNER